MTIGMGNVVDNDEVTENDNNDGNEDALCIAEVLPGAVVCASSSHCSLLLPPPGGGGRIKKLLEVVVVESQNHIRKTPRLVV